jgi:hypothetical protein
MERGPWGLVTLAWGTLTPALTPELPPELPEDFAPLVDDFAPDLPEEVLLEFSLDLAVSLAAEVMPDATALPIGDSSTLPSMGANPSAMVASQRAKSIVLSVRTVRACPRGRIARRDRRRNPRQPATHARREQLASPYTGCEPNELVLVRAHGDPRA